MTRQIALLRGINVGGARRLAMADLRASMAALGYAEATTLLQSGNVVYRSPDPPATAERRIRERLAGDTGLDIPVIVRTAAEMRAVVERNPLRGRATIPKWHHVVFLSELPDRSLAEALDGSEFEPDLVALHGREAFVWWPQGARNARLTPALLERRLAVAATARNWNTVEKLRALSDDG